MSLTLVTAIPQNPLNLSAQYTWMEGDTFMLIALKYRRIDRWTELLDYNKLLVSKCGYRMCAGDVITIPPDWFPLPNIQAPHGIKFIGGSDKGIRT